jgi:hypothetical protein
VNHRLATDFAAILPLLESDQEGTSGHDTGHIGGIPAVTLEEQVLVAGEAQQRNTGVFARIGILAEKNGVLAQDLRELGGKGRHGSDGFPKILAVARDDAQVLVFDVVKQDVSGHVVL